ncbi:MAG TPA: hypothetical protein VGH97_05910 [Thermoanaerobaculia bacterium]
MKRYTAGLLAAVSLLGFASCNRRGASTSTGPTLYPFTVDRFSQASPLERTLHIANQDKAVWVAYEAKHTLTITFNSKLYPAIAKGEPPFEGGANGADQVLSDTSGTVYSPAINHKLKDVFAANPGVTELDYTFDQKVDTLTKDGRIIIMK